MASTIAPTTPMTSVEWREKGNKSFKSFVESRDNSRRRTFLQSAIESYTRSFETADNDADKASAAKNYATAAWRLTTVLGALGEHHSFVDFRFREAVNYFSKATVVGARSKDRSWQNELTQSFGNCIDEAIEAIRNYPYHARVVALEKLTQVMSEDSQKSECFLEMATVMSHEGYSALSKKNFLAALQAFHDCYRPIQECYRLEGSKSHIYKEAKVIDADLCFHMATAEAMKAIKNGDDTLKQALEDDEELIMDKIYDVIDLYHSAVIATREVEVEMEATAYSRLGHVFDRVVKLKSKAKEYFNQSMYLASTLSPRNFTSENWYKTCTEALQRYQSEAVSNDVAKQQSEREQFLKELEQELKDINAAAVGSLPDGFLRYLYQAFPPKNPRFVLEASQLQGSRKKVLLRAVFHYHPDKQDVEAHGRKWSVLCEEITKLLNQYYERSKGIDWDQPLDPPEEESNKEDAKPSRKSPRQKAGDNKDNSKKKDADGGDVKDGCEKEDANKSSGEEDDCSENCEDDDDDDDDDDIAYEDDSNDSDYVATESDDEEDEDIDEQPKRKRRRV